MSFAYLTYEKYSIYVSVLNIHIYEEKQKSNLVIILLSVSRLRHR